MSKDSDRDREVARVGGVAVVEKADGRLKFTGACTLAEAVDIDRALREYLGNRGVRGLTTVREMGQRGGTSGRDKHGHEHFVEIGRKGGSRVRELLAAGRAAEDERKGKP